MAASERLEYHIDEVMRRPYLEFFVARSVFGMATVLLLFALTWNEDFGNIDAISLEACLLFNCKKCNLPVPCNKHGGVWSVCVCARVPLKQNSCCRPVLDLFWQILASLPRRDTAIVSRNNEFYLTPATNFVISIFCTSYIKVHVERTFLTQCEKCLHYIVFNCAFDEKVRFLCTLQYWYCNHIVKSSTDLFFFTFGDLSCNGASDSFPYHWAKYAQWHCWVLHISCAAMQQHIHYCSVSIYLLSWACFISATVYTSNTWHLTWSCQ